MPVARLRRRRQITAADDSPVIFVGHLKYAPEKAVHRPPQGHDTEQEDPITL